MKTELKKFLLALPGFQALCRLLTRRHVRALMYHRFSGIPGDDRTHPDGAVLRRQLELIARHHAAWSVDDHLASLADGSRPAGRCPVVVTVDDGYRDFYEVAYPEFRRLGIPVTLFVTTGFVDGGFWFWWDRLRYVINEAPHQRFSFDLDGRRLDLDLTDADGRRRAWHAVADRCRFIPDNRRQAAITRLEQELRVSLPDHPPAPIAPVSWDEVREMAAAGVGFGAHTVRHPILSRLDDAAARREIAESGRRLAAELGRDVGWFCYPQGGPADYTAANKKMVAEAGYRGCYVAYQDMRRPVDRYALPRYCIDADVTEFAWTLCGAEFLVLRMRRLLGQSTDPGEGYWSGADGPSATPVTEERATV